jgi:hypothetical protein
MRKARSLAAGVAAVLLLSAASFPQALPATATVKSAQDSVTADSLQSPESQIKVIKRDTNPRDQLKFGTAIMVFIITVMVLSNNFNPD